MLALTGIEKSFGPVVVLRGVDLEVRGGEVHAVLGENGAGKSTLMRIMLGIERADRGTMRLGEEAYAPRGPADARQLGVVMVPQERTLCPHLTVVENIVLGIEPVGMLGVLRASDARAVAERSLALVAGPGRVALHGLRQRRPSGEDARQPHFVGPDHGAVDPRPAEVAVDE